MSLRIKNFVIIGVHWKIRFLGGLEGGSEKTNIGGIGQFADLRGGGDKEGDGVFGRVVTQYTL